MNQILFLLQILFVVFQCSNSFEEGSPCLEEVKPGPCKAHFPRFHYDIDSQVCKQFIFGGCQSNGNNFLTFQQCMDRCFSKGKLDNHGKCRDGSSPLSTTVNPCQVTVCNKENSICYADYCIRQNNMARFFTKEGVEIDSTDC